MAELVDDTDDYIGGLCVGRAKKAREDFHKKLVSPWPVSALWHPLAGFGRRTVQTAVFDGSQLTAPSFRNRKNTLPSAQALGVNELVRQELDSGDGTVPALSAGGSRGCSEGTSNRRRPAAGSCSSTAPGSLGRGR